MSHTIVSDKCECLGECRSVCPEDCIVLVKDPKNAAGVSYSAIDPLRCTDCGACRSLCPIDGAILDAWRPELQRSIAQTRAGLSRTPSLHGELTVALALGIPGRLRETVMAAGIDRSIAAAPDLLHHAAAMGAAACCDVLLEAGYPVDGRDAAGETPLVAAIAWRRPRQRALLMVTGEETDRGRDTLKTCRLLLHAGADPDVVDASRRTPLHHAVEAADEAGVWLLIERGARLDWRDASGRTPLHRAAEAGAVRLIAPLVAAGADPTAPDGEDATPLERALQHACVHGAAALLLATGGTDVRRDPLALHALAFTGDIDRLVRAIPQAPDLDARDPLGRTALHWAAQAGRAGAVALLLDAGARPDLVDATGASVSDDGLSLRLTERQRAGFAIAFRIPGDWTLP
jgi:ankyrin repeat protein/NAD-dependent dihydropyrimidine dehydrogenase PreA subunit